MIGAMSSANVGFFLIVLVWEQPETMRIDNRDGAKSLFIRVPIVRQAETTRGTKGTSLCPLCLLWFLPVRLEVDTGVQSNGTVSGRGRDATESGTVDVRA